MKTLRAPMLLLLSGALAACHTAPVKHQQPPPPVTTAGPSEPAEPPVASDTAPSADDMKVEPEEIPPCLPVDSSPKPAPKRKPKPVVHTEPPPPAPAPTPPPQAAADGGVVTLTNSSASILGRKVIGQEGDDLGRVVDVLADAQGRVRVAIIEFGGFLGVGNRRIAVDWSLLKFHPENPEAPVQLNVAKQRLQTTPEYKGAARPQVLMGPEATAVTRPAAPN